MTAFWVSLFLVLIAEMGDKTQLVALAFAARYPAQTVLSGVFVATLLVQLFSVLLGTAARLALPLFWIELLAGVAFIAVGLWTLRGDKLREKQTRENRLGPLATVAATFFLAELGDKTMLTTITVASQQHAFAAVWIGSSLGMLIANGAAIAVGRILGKQIPERAIRYGAAIIFFASGIVTLVKALR